MRKALRFLLDKTGDVDRKDINEAIRRVARVSGTTTTEAQDMALATSKSVDRFNRRDVVRSIGIDIKEYKTSIGERWRRDHISLIKSIPNEAKSRFIGILRDASRKQTRVETIRGQLEEQLGITYRRARLIARDQVLTLNAKLNEERHLRAGIVEYDWHSLSDGSVRSNHSHLHGKRFRYDDPPLGGGTGPNDRGNPGTGIGCRCQAIPVIPEFETPRSSVKSPKRQGRPSKNAAIKAAIVKGAKGLDIPQSGLRDQSFRFLRSGGKPDPKYPVTIAVEPDGKRYFIDGRHRVSIARGLGESSVDGVLIGYDNDGNILWKHRGPIPIE